MLRAPGRILAGTWQAVHGKIEGSETAWQAALRELREETRLTPTAFWQLEIVNSFYVARTDKLMMCPGFAAEVSPDAFVQLCEEHDDFAWWPADVARERYMWPGQRAAVAEIMKVIIADKPAAEHMRIAID